MSILPNPKHEAFAQGLARGLSISAAYVQAGYKPNRGNAHTAFQNESRKFRLNNLLFISKSPPKLPLTRK
jgi:phage terminase small subunit